MRHKKSNSLVTLETNFDSYNRPIFCIHLLCFLKMILLASEQYFKGWMLQFTLDLNKFCLIFTFLISSCGSKTCLLCFYSSSASWVIQLEIKWPRFFWSFPQYLRFFNFLAKYFVSKSTVMIKINVLWVHRLPELLNWGL